MFDGVLGRMVDGMLSEMFDGVLGRMVDAMLGRMFDVMLGRMFDVMLGRMFDGLLGSMLARMFGGRLGRTVNRVARRQLRQTVRSNVGDSKGLDLMPGRGGHARHAAQAHTHGDLWEMAAQLVGHAGHQPNYVWQADEEVQVELAACGMDMAILYATVGRLSPRRPF